MNYIYLPRAVKVQCSKCGKKAKIIPNPYFGSLLGGWYPDGTKLCPSCYSPIYCKKMGIVKPVCSSILDSI